MQVNTAGGKNRRAEIVGAERWRPRWDAPDRGEIMEEANPAVPLRQQPARGERARHHRGRGRPPHLVPLIHKPVEANRSAEGSG